VPSTVKLMTAAGVAEYARCLCSAHHDPDVQADLVSEPCIEGNLAGNEIKLAADVSPSCPASMMTMIESSSSHVSPPITARMSYLACLQVDVCCVVA
jgi:hypothetical protein